MLTLGLILLVGGLALYGRRCQRRESAARRAALASAAPPTNLTVVVDTDAEPAVNETAGAAV